MSLEWFQFPQHKFLPHICHFSSISEVLWVGTLIYPAEVKGECTVKEGDSLDGFPYSWLFLVVYSKPSPFAC